jgi:hypothetical protein
MGGRRKGIGVEKCRAEGTAFDKKNRGSGGGEGMRKGKRRDGGLKERGIEDKDTEVVNGRKRGVDRR